MKRESRLARWSRLKSAAREEERQRKALQALQPQESQSAQCTGAMAPSPSVPAADETARPAATPARSTDEIVAALPDVQTLDAESDYTGFLAEGVPEELAKVALRKLWLSDPVLANIDGLNDYDDDFNVIDQLIEASDTGYRVGKGHFTDEEIRARDGVEETAEPDVDPQADDAVPVAVDEAPLRVPTAQAEVREVAGELPLAPDARTVAQTLEMAPASPGDEAAAALRSPSTDTEEDAGRTAAPAPDRSNPTSA